MKLTEEDLEKEVEEVEPDATFLFVNTAGVSDVLMNSQVCQDIKRFVPNSKIIMVTDGKYLEAAQGIKEADLVFEYDKNTKNKGFLGLLKFLFKFKYKYKIDYSFCNADCDNALILSTFLGAKEKHTYRPSDWLLKLERLLNIEVHLSEKSSNVAQDMQKFLESMVDVTPYADRLNFKYPKEADMSISSKLSSVGLSKYPIITICPCSDKSDSAWSAKDVAELMELAYEDGKRIVLIGDKEDSWFANELKKHTKRKFADMIGKLSVFETAALAKKSQVVISANNSAMHLAYASGAKTICLFFNSYEFYKWAPKGYPNTVVLHRPEGVPADKCYEYVKNMTRPQFE